MKLEDKYIDYLFESAREEAPQLSFEEVAEVFSTSTPPTLLGSAKGWFLKNIYLNSVLFLSAGTLVFMAFFLSSSSNNSNENKLNKNLIVTNQIQESPATKITNLETIEKSSEVLPPKKAKNLRAKKTKISLGFSLPKIEFQKINKNLISKSPILLSISPKLKFEDPQKKPLALAIKNIGKEKTITGYQPKNKTTEEAISPWVVGQESEMPWKIKRQVNTPILNETERVLQRFMDTKYLEQIFEKEENDYFKPLKMLVYYSVNENYFIQFKGNKIRLLKKEISPDFDPNEPFIDVKRFKIKKTKAYFNFTYKDYQVQMQLRRVGEGWKRHKLKVKKDKQFLTNISF